jgi:hypothetical protein
MCEQCMGFKSRLHDSDAMDIGLCFWDIEQQPSSYTVNLSLHVMGTMRLLFIDGSGSGQDSQPIRILCIRGRASVERLFPKGG